MTAKDIEFLLSEKHHDDIFVPQCKTGPTWTSNSLRIMDAWTMPRSWTNPAVTAYEIKVNRSDFLNDTKWPNYLNYCNMFYFVCPPDIIHPSELPEEAGLMVTSKNGTRLFTRKKAPIRQTPIPEKIFRYILMSRSKIKDYDIPDGIEYWQSWLMNKNITRELGLRVSKNIREVIRHEIDLVKNENLTLKKRVDEYDEIRNILKKAGLDDLNPNRWSVYEMLKETAPQIARRSIYSLGQLKRDIESIIELLGVPKEDDQIG